MVVRRPWGAGVIVRMVQQTPTGTLTQEWYEGRAPGRADRAPFDEGRNVSADAASDAGESNP